ncbi:MAG TPA: hypothetical protein PKY81_11015 [bacterium]|nr:hypothetical protein [bacterium]HPN31480.1 hypothetical protein [bacterium]
MDNFKYERTDLGEKLWKLTGSKAWVFDKINQVELLSGNLELFKTSKKSKIDKIDMEFTNCLFNKSTNSIKLHNNIKTVFYGDTNLIMRTSELEFDGESKVENEVKNAFNYGDYILTDKGLYYNREASILILKSDITLKNKSGDYLNADNGQIELNSQFISLNKIKKGEFDGYVFSADKCEMKSNTLILYGNVKITDKTNALKTEKLVYDMKNKTIFLEPAFTISSDTIKFSGRNSIINSMRKTIKSDSSGSLITQGNKINFGKIIYSGDELVLNENAIIENDSFVLTSKTLRALGDQNKNIKKIYTNVPAEIVYKKGGGLKSGKLALNFSGENRLDSALLSNNIEVCSGAYNLKSDSAFIKFKDNKPDKMDFSGTVILTDGSMFVKTSRLFSKFLENFPSKIYSGNDKRLINNFMSEGDFFNPEDFFINGDSKNFNLQKNDKTLESEPADKDFKITVENDSYSAAAKNIFLDLTQKSIITGKSYGKIELFDKISNSKLKGGSLAFDYINKKFKNITIRGEVSGSIVWKNKTSVK